jgi:hypothetical protein
MFRTSANVSFTLTADKSIQRGLSLVLNMSKDDVEDLDSLGGGWRKSI